MGNIYVSSVAFKNQNIDAVIELAKQHQWNIEFSAGLQDDGSLEAAYLATDLVRMPHNYFLADQPPFVLNLASADETVLARSMQHCKKMLRIAKASGASFFAAHAGFCIDPKPDELGRKIHYTIAIDKAKHFDIFFKALREILATADEVGIDFYIENNVLAPFNFTDNNINPLLCAESSEIIHVFNEIQHPRFGLLLDTAHLKVSMQTLGLDAASEWQQILPFVKAFHHSDNNGLEDNNQPLTENYWCKNYLPTQGIQQMTHVIEVKSLTANEIQDQLQLIHKILFP